MDLAALQAAMNRDYNSDSGSGSSYAGSQPGTYFTKKIIIELVFRND